MTRSIIPQVRMIKCDRCGWEQAEHQVGHFRCEARLIMSTGPHEDPLEYDLCDNCVKLMEQAVKQCINRGSMA